MMEIDAVITWVDGNDPTLAEKRRAYAPASSLEREDVGGATRFASIGEIHWCIASINRFAPWIRRIYIVTDGQNPCVQSSIPVEIVDHKTIFAGYEEYLPTFNSVSIETMMWRIPGLSEHFIYFNDDLMLLRECSPEDFFTPEGRPYCAARMVSRHWMQLLRDLKPSQGGVRPVTIKTTMLQSVAIAGNPLRFPFLEHTPRPYLKSFFEKTYAERPCLIERNISERFRSCNQFRVDTLHYMLLLEEGGAELTSWKKNLLYLQAKPEPGYVERHLARKGDWRFACFNSLDRALPEALDAVKAFVSAVLAR
ncbi:MAG: Stealth CR1 domain-containing protein [Bacteroidales bacterium]|nr:Stealth CR1 domain-containing protein [Candidatus Cryptobacteroides aphodequi]